MWRACVLPWGKIVARVNCMGRRVEEWEAKRERKREREREKGGAKEGRERERRGVGEKERESRAGVHIPPGQLQRSTVPPTNQWSFSTSLSHLVSPVSSPSVHSSFFFSRFSSVPSATLRPSYVIWLHRTRAHTRRPPPEIYTVLTLTTASIPSRRHPCGCVYPRTGNLSKLRSSLKRAVLILLTSSIEDENVGKMESGGNRPVSFDVACFYLRNGEPQNFISHHRFISIPLLI